MSIAEIIEEGNQAVEAAETIAMKQRARQNMLDKLVLVLEEAEAKARTIDSFQLNTRLSCDIHRWIQDVKGMRSLG